MFPGCPECAEMPLNKGVSELITSLQQPIFRLKSSLFMHIRVTRLLSCAQRYSENFKYASALYLIYIKALLKKQKHIDFPNRKYSLELPTSNKNGPSSESPVYCRSAIVTGIITGTIDRLDCYVIRGRIELPTCCLGGSCSVH